MHDRKYASTPSSPPEPEPKALRTFTITLQSFPVDVAIIESTELEESCTESRSLTSLKAVAVAMSVMSTMKYAYPRYMSIV